MANYYQLRRAAFADIDFMIQEGKPIEYINWAITKKYGFSSRIVDERVQQIKELKAAQDFMEAENKAEEELKEKGAVKDVESEED